MGTGELLALASQVCLAVFIVFTVWSILTFEDDVRAWIAAGSFFAWIGLGIASILMIQLDWSDASLWQKFALVEAYIALGLTFLFLGVLPLLLMVFGPPYFLFRKARRWRRIVLAEGRRYDDDGIEIHRDENYERYYPMHDRRLFPTGYKKVCWWEDDEGTYHLCNQDGSRLGKRPPFDDPDLAQADIQVTPYAYRRKQLDAAEASGS